MPDRVTYQLDGMVAQITMDDGKVNALSNDMQAELTHAFDKAETDGAVVVLAGRDGVFSAGFDLKTLQAGGPRAVEMLLGGFELSYRLLSFPRPVVIACTGHAMAMGLFLLLSGDERIGTAGADHKLVANEVQIGLTLPHAAVEICRQRIQTSHLPRVANLAEEYRPEAALAAGLLDRVVPAGAVVAEAQAAAERMAGLNLDAHAGTKARIREPALAALRAAIDRDAAELRAVL